VISHNETGVLAGLRTALIILISIAGGAAVLLTIGTFFRDTWWVFDYAANFRWQLMWGLAAAAVIHAIVGRGIAPVLFLIAAVVNAWFIAPLWMESQPTATGEDGILVVHADVYPRVDDVGFVLRWFLETEADLILVAGTTAERMELLARDDSPYSIIIAPDRPGVAGIVALATQDWPVEVTFSEDLAEPVYRITVGADGEVVDIVTTWGDPGSSAKNADLLAARLAAVSDAVASASNPVTVIGNVGATRWTEGMETLRDANNLRDAMEGSGYLSTWPVSGIPLIGSWIGIPIDVVLMTDEITPLQLSTGPDIGAEHLPVVVEIGPAFQG